MKIIILLSFVIQVSFASDKSCLKEVWEITKPTPEEKTFDIENDLNSEGDSYSCDAYTTPSMVNKFITSLKESIYTNDINHIAKMMKYPLYIGLPGYTSNKSGIRIYNSIIIKNKDEFLEKFNSQIITSELIEVINCVNIKNLIILPSNGIGIAFGAIKIHVDYYTKKMAILKLSKRKKTFNKWLKRICEN